MQKSAAGASQAWLSAYERTEIVSLLEAVQPAVADCTMDCVMDSFKNAKHSREEWEGIDREARRQLERLAKIGKVPPSRCDAKGYISDHRDYAALGALCLQAAGCCQVVIVNADESAYDEACTGALARLDEALGHIMAIAADKQDQLLWAAEKQTKAA